MKGVVQYRGVPRKSLLGLLVNPFFGFLFLIGLFSSIELLGDETDDCMRAAIGCLREAGWQAPADSIPPDPDPGGELEGGDPCSGFWDGWRADDADRFLTVSNYGVMLSNVNAARKTGLTFQGFHEFDVWHESDGCGGGQHLFYITSQTDPRIGPYDPEFPNLDGLLRVDLSVRPDRLYGVMFYDSDPEMGEFQHTVTALGTWPLVAYRTWAHVRIEWAQTPTTTTITINGRPISFNTPAGANPVGNMLVVGNMDRNTDPARCNSCGHNPCGLVGQVRFRGFRSGM